MLQSFDGVSCSVIWIDFWLLAGATVCLSEHDFTTLWAVGFSVSTFGVLRPLIRDNNSATGFLQVE